MDRTEPLSPMSSPPLYLRLKAVAAVERCAVTVITFTCSNTLERLGFHCGPVFYKSSCHVTDSLPCVFYKTVLTLMARGYSSDTDIVVIKPISLDPKSLESNLEAGTCDALQSIHPSPTGFPLYKDKDIFELPRCSGVTISNIAMDSVEKGREEEKG
eukprot:7646561-Ditylum_brightwellii.AAC.1